MSNTMMYALGVITGILLGILAILASIFSKKSAEKMISKVENFVKKQNMEVIPPITDKAIRERKRVEQAKAQGLDHVAYE